MDAASIGREIARYRKKCGMTQLQLADRLNVSHKTVSRWENGLGYPEVTQFPELASIFGITIDRLMVGRRRGIAVAGNILTDIVKTIDVYPAAGMLANISDITMAVGGCVPNVTIDLAKIDASLPVSALGKIGNDEYGRFLLSSFGRYGIDCSGILTSPTRPTSFSDVMSQPDGERTFFHIRGSNAEFGPADIDLASLGCAILHIGYIFLLDEFDRDDSEYGTVMARFLHDVQQAGIKTSIDVVSSSENDYAARVLPAVRYCNYVIINEIESSMLSGLKPYRDDGSIDLENIRKTMEFIASQGVRERVIVHCKDAGFCLDVASGNFTCVPSLAIPVREIRGSVGAGDAFCAGCLYGLYHGYDDVRLLEFASAAAACNLFAENSTDGMLSRAEIEKLSGKYGRKRLATCG